MQKEEAGLQNGVIGTSLDHLAGTWSEADARPIDEVSEDFERIEDLPLAIV